MQKRQPLAIALVLLAALPAFADLDAYLKRPEPEAKWEKTADETADGVRAVTLEMTSQVWRGIPWKHAVRAFRPEKPALADLAVLIVTGGRGGEKDKAYGVQAAQACGCAVAILYGVPNQPLFGGKVEDDLVAHTFQEFVKSGDEEWPLLFPMTKSAVKAMDAVQELGRQSWGGEVKRFVVTGASKRGWTTWLTGASDPRVAGIAPIVYDNLNLVPQMKNQIATWGAYSNQITDYTRRNLQALLETEQGRKLGALVDPYAFRDRLERIPKLIINGTNDPYWTLDALNLYWDGLKGEKAVLYVPNGTHGISGAPRTTGAQVALVRRVGAGRTLPPLRWEHGESGGTLTLTMTCEEAPTSARLWGALSPTRDFRKAKWESTAMTGEGTAYAGKAERPAAGFLALFGEADFKEGDRSFSLSTAVRIVEAGK